MAISYSYRTAWICTSQDQLYTDALHLRYSRSPSHLPSHCVCGKAFSVSHSLSCPHIDFPIIQHKDIRHLTAKLMSEVCHDVQVEPHLQPQLRINHSITNLQCMKNMPG